MDSQSSTATADWRLDLHGQSKTRVLNPRLCVSWAHPSARPRWLVPTSPRPRLTASCTRRPAMDATYAPTASFPITLLYANGAPGRGHLSPISDSPFAPGTFSRAQPSWQGTWLVFRARDFRVFQRADAPFFWAVELRVHDYKGCSCDMRERERERMSGFGLGARCAAPSCRVWSVELFRLVWKI